MNDDIDLGSRNRIENTMGRIARALESIAARFLGGNDYDTKLDLIITKLEGIESKMATEAENLDTLKGLVASEGSALDTINENLKKRAATDVIIAGDLGTLLLAAKNAGTTGDPADVEAVVAQAQALVDKQAAAVKASQDAVDAGTALDADIKTALNVPIAPTSSDTTKAS